jgi:hypothetical protein
VNLPEEGVQLDVTLNCPVVALDTGDRFAIREGGKTVGSGAVTKIVGKIDFFSTFAAATIRGGWVPRQ